MENLLVVEVTILDPLRGSGMVIIWIAPQWGGVGARAQNLNLIFRGFPMNRDRGERTTTAYSLPPFNLPLTLPFNFLLLPSLLPSALCPLPFFTV